MLGREGRKERKKKKKKRVLFVFGGFWTNYQYGGGDTRGRKGKRVEERGGGGRGRGDKKEGIKWAVSCSLLLTLFCSPNPL